MAYYEDRRRTSFNDMTNLPVKSVKVNEGPVTRLDNVVEPTGGTTSVIDYTTTISKGDLVVIDSKYSTVDQVVVTMRIASKHDYANGVAVSSPRGTDTKTESGYIASVEDMRTVDIAFFGTGIMEFVANVPITAGNTVSFENTEGFGNYITTTGTANTKNGTMIGMKTVNEGDYCPVLLGVYGYDESAVPAPSKLTSKSKKTE